MPPSCCAPAAPARNATAVEAVTTTRFLWLQIDIDDAPEDADHLIGTEERLRIAMARQ
jgi:hypothetical protein